MLLCVAHYLHVMKPSFHTPFNYRYLTGAFLLSALFLGGKAQAQVDFYVSETAQSNHATTILEFAFNPTTGTATPIGTYTPTGVFGGTTAEEDNLQFTENGTSLSYAGFTSAAATKSSEVLFTPSTGAFDTSTTASGTIRSSYYGTTTGGTSGFFGATGSQSLAFVSHGGTASASVVSNTGTLTGEIGTSAIDVTYNGGTQNLYYTRNTTNGGVYTPSTNGLGLVASAVPFTELTGSGWGTGNLYTGMAFLGTSNLFVANTTTNTLDLFTAANPDETTDWNLKFHLTLSTTEDIEQISVDPLSATTADIFFTTDGNASGVLSTGGISTIEEVSYNSSTGFGTPNVLESSSTEYFTGVAAVPEPGTYGMFGLGFGLLVWIARKKAGRKAFLS